MERNDERGRRFTALLNRPIMVPSQPISVPPPPPPHPKNSTKIFGGAEFFLKEREKGAPRRGGKEWKTRKGVFHIYIRDRGGFLPSSLCKKKKCSKPFFLLFPLVVSALKKKYLVFISWGKKKKKLCKVKSPHLGCNIVQTAFFIHLFNSPIKNNMQLINYLLQPWWKNFFFFRFK